MLKSIWQWITRNTFNGRFHDHYADMTPEEHRALLYELECDRAEQEANLIDMEEQWAKEQALEHSVWDFDDFNHANNEYILAQTEDDDEEN